ncbi:Low-affinity potassium transport protein [Pichia kudriavzevii]|uniref:Low-affinity potassium transport protein n=1 Tax=Pichia kudriavzevii TaxID=4909 RepID=A0A1V2LL78_PICKU|nr:Low-affinity potassium transport protein [Pichia kudriavzevii]
MAHYVYILLWVIVGSIVLYPSKNLDYIDCLMFAAGAATQGGLAPQQLNDVKLYQQITIYMVCMFTTPIFIHGSLTFIRLYWYEKRFDDIKEKSINQYKMRRSKTIANLRSETNARTIGRYDVDKKLDDSNEVFTSKINTSLNHDHAVESPTTNIKFGELPKPFKKKERDIAPRDLYMSISALQNDSNSDFDDEMGPALHFKSPHELEKDKRKVPLRRRKHRKILREKKLKELKKKALPLLQTEKSIVDTELAEQQGRNFDFTSQTNIDTNADLTKKEKARRAMSSPMLEKPDIGSHQELPLDFDSTAYKPGFKHFQRSHTLHMPEFSKKLFSNFDNSNVSPGQENVDEFPYLKRFKSRRPSIFTKRRTYSNLDQLSDDDFVNNYLTNVPTNYLSWKPTVGRNSKFIALTKQQKIELGGVETAGFNVVNLASLNPAIQVSYMVMMYISVLPLAISIRRTNVYEEQSLGVYEREDEDHTDSKPRHRGLPNSIDRAIMLSDEKLNLRDDLEAYHAMRRTATTMSNTETMFPSITKVATGQRRQTIDRQPTISENIRQGVIPWGDILTKVGHLLGKTVANILTVSGAPKEEKYARQMTRYSTFDDYPLRSRSTSQYTRRNSNFEDRNMGYDNYHDNDDDISFNSSVGESESVPLKNYPPFSDGRDGKNNHSQTYSQEERSVRNYYPVRSSNGANGDSESIVTPESYVSDLHSSISSKKRKLN